LKKALQLMTAVLAGHAALIPLTQPVVPGTHIVTVDCTNETTLAGPAGPEGPDGPLGPVGPGTPSQTNCTLPFPSATITPLTPAGQLCGGAAVTTAFAPAAPFGP